MKKKTGRRFVAHVPVRRAWGKEVALPRELETEIHTREPEHIAKLTCPLCGAVRYVTKAQLDFVAGLVGEADEYAAIAHKPCRSIMQMEMLP